MPYETTWEKIGIFWNPYGNVTGKGIEQITIDMFGDSRFDDIRYLVLDFLGTDDFVMSDDELEAIADQDMAAAVTNPYIKVAVITTNPRVRKLSTMFGDMFGGHTWEISVLPNLEKSRRWCQ